MTKPAILGGEPIFSPPLPFARPTLEEPGTILESIGRSLESGFLTDGPLVESLEDRVQETFGVEHCVAVSSCTIGLMLVIQALSPAAPVLVPSFTFSATAHAVRWNGLPVRFADCDPDTWCLQPDDVDGQPGMVIGVHVSGVPCDVVGLERVARGLGIPLIFDAAHAAGSLVSVNGSARALGAFGAAEVFSLTPTKVMSGVEGGLVTTNDAGLAQHLRMARNYGNPGDYDTRFPGMNARLSELHAAVALASLDHLSERVAQRNRLADRYRAVLAGIPGIRFQSVPAGSRSSCKDLTILLDAQLFGCSRDAVRSALAAEGVETRAYYSPPVHLQTAYADQEQPVLPVTEQLADQVVSLPVWSHMDEDTAEAVAEAFLRIHRHSEEIVALTG